LIAFTLAIGVATLVAGVGGAFALRWLPTLRLQLLGLGLLTAVLPLGAVLASGIAMFNSGHDFAILVVTAATSTVAVAAALLVGRRIAMPIEGLRSVASRLARGELSSRASVGGPSELAQLASSLNEMAAKLEGLFDARRELVAWASHDLRTPLASLQAMLEATEDGLVEPEHYLPGMRDAVGTLASLVDDLFELARIDSGVLTLELRTAPVAGLVESCVRRIEAEAQALEVRLETKIQSEIPPVVCAPEKVQRVLMNLLTNALRHTPSDGAVAVLVEPLGTEVRVTVADTGEGLAADTATRMFDVFWRGDRSRSPGNGTDSGLGLAIARGLVEAQGGRIWAENRKTGGASVSFTLPVASSA
jgi:signal transduction histidine kinase